MKKNKFISIIIFLILSVSLIACLFTGCDFIQYVEKPGNTQVISAEVKSLQENYVERLYTATSEIKYREDEQKIFDYALQDAVNELYECRSETELKQVYEKHLTVIGKIKTDKEYSDEEEANAISAYRVAILGQAEKSYDKQKYSGEQITYFDKVFSTFSGELFETNDREEMNGLLQKFYFDVHKEDEILSLINYADISVYDESQKELLSDTLNKCIEDIRSCIDEEDIDGIKEVYKFEVYKRDTVKKLNEYVDLQLYRDVQAAQIKLILKEQLNLAEEAETKVEEDNIFREYQMAVADYNIPTDEMLYTEELEELKDQLNGSLGNTYKLSFYREDEGLAVQEELESFQDLLKTIKKKEDVLSQYLLVKSRLDSIKTAKQLDEEDRLNLIEELYVDLQNRIEKNIDGEDKIVFLEKAVATYAAMQDRISVEGVRTEHRVLVKEISAKFGAAIELLKMEVDDYKSDVYFRENEQNQLDKLKEEYAYKLDEDIGIEKARSLVKEAKDAIDVIKTNDDLWNDSVKEFRAELESLYGDAILGEPRSLTEANDYFELAKIIDYYAFYQLSGTEFVCDTFRVKLNFDHNNAIWERNEVYWYCELLKSAVDIKAEFERNSDYLVCTLIPYRFASKSNRVDTEKIVRGSSLVEYDSDKTGFVARSDNFDDFAYYRFDKKAKVWNSQQLWYSLEHGYVPVCVENSPAENMLNKAKQVLRTVIKEGMSTEEKVFNIYKWFGENVQFDNLHQNYNFSSDINNFPNEEISALKSHFIEGVLDEGLAVCIGYAKTYLLMLRIEGIEAKLNIGRMPYMEGNNTIGAIANSFHVYVFLKFNDAWYYSDCERSFAGSDETLISYLCTCLPKDTTYLYEVTNKELIAATDLDFYKNLSLNKIKLFVKSKEELLQAIDAFKQIEKRGIVSVFYDAIAYKECWNDMLEYGNSYDILKITRGNLSELVVSIDFN